MKPKFWQTKDFIELEKEWYEKLEKSKFEDAEKRVGGEWVLKQRSSNSYRGSCETQREGKRRYFELLAQFFHSETRFLDEVEEFVMEKRACGHTINAISAILKRAKERNYRGAVRRIIKKYEKKWRIKSN